MAKLRTLEHGMLLRAKHVMDNAMGELEQIKELIPVRLHAEFDKMIAQFEDTLCTADVQNDYQEK